MNSIFHVLVRAGFLGGTVFGAWLGEKYGTAESIACASAAGGLGLLAGRIPEWLTVRQVRRDLGARSSRELRRFFRDPECGVHNYVLIELLDRGEDIQEELPVLLDLLASADIHRRARGWAAFTSAFPEFVEELGGYCAADSMDVCRQQTNAFRQSVEQARALRAAANQLRPN